MHSRSIALTLVLAIVATGCGNQPRPTVQATARPAPTPELLSSHVQPPYGMGPPIAFGGSMSAARASLDTAGLPCGTPIVVQGLQVVSCLRLPATTHEILNVIAWPEVVLYGRADGSVAGVDVTFFGTAASTPEAMAGRIVEPLRASITPLFRPTEAAYLMRLALAKMPLQSPSRLELILRGPITLWVTAAPRRVVVNLWTLDAAKVAETYRSNTTEQIFF